MKNNILLKFNIAFILLFVVFYKVSFVRADVEYNNTSVPENSDLNYYLSVHSTINGYYLKNSNSVYYFEPSVMNDYIYVEDKLPDGLEFVGFVTSSNGSFGAVSDTDGNSVCSGYVVDDTHESSNTTGSWNQQHTEYTYHGLHYNAETRTVSFKIADLETECYVNVGIKTRTPSLGTGQTRIDFNNYASAVFSKLMVFSNLTNRFIGNENATLYSVNFTYDLSSDELALLNLPPSINFAEGENVSLPNDVFYLGHHFDGWTSNDVTITNGKFVMPNQNVTLVGHFSQIQGHNVSYRIDGTVPDDYVVPSTKMFYPDATVKIDSLSAGDIINGYEFQGWVSSDYTDGDSKRFVMPNNDVEFVGHFIPKKYTVNYNFIRNNLPSNADSLLPSSQEYSSGEVVHLPSISQQGNYVFAGWDYKDGFKMPKRDITVNGFWQEYMGTYDPQFSVEIINEKEYYKPGDIIKFNIQLKNDTGESFRVGLQSDIKLKNYDSYENGVYYYNISEDTTISGSYLVVEDNDLETELETEIVYFSQDYSEFKYDLEEDSYVQTVTIELSPRLYLCQKFVDSDIEMFGIGNITFKISNNQYDYDVSLHKKCTFIYLDPGTYHINEFLPMEQSVSVVLGLINANDSDFVIDDDNSKENVIVFINEFDPTTFIKFIAAKLIKTEPACSNTNSSSDPILPDPGGFN